MHFGDRWLAWSAALRAKSGDRLELWLPRNWPNEDNALQWRHTLAGGEVREGSQRGLQGILPAADIIVWTPAADTLLVRARLPTRSTTKIVQALPYALEEQLTEPPERLHFAFAHESDGSLAVAVTSRECIEGWLAALAAAGLSPTHLAPVTLSLPLVPDAWTMAFIGDEVVLRHGLRAGFGGSIEPMPPAWLHALLTEARGDSRAPGRICTIDAPSELNLSAWQEALALPMETLQHANTIPAVPLNLLQQRLAPRGRMTTMWRGYIPATALLGAWFAATLVFDTAEWIRVTSALRAAEAQLSTLLKQSFPETRVVLDPAAQMSRGIEELSSRKGASSPDDLLSLLARAAPVIERTSRARVQRLEYADRALIIHAAASESDAEFLAGSLRALSLNVEVGGSDGAFQLRIRAVIPSSQSVKP